MTRSRKLLLLVFALSFGLAVATDQLARRNSPLQAGISDHLKADCAGSGLFLFHIGGC